MKILIVGAGEIGYHLAKVLSLESHDVTVIDNEKESIRQAQNLDIKVLEGDATSVDCLKRGSIETSDVVIAVTSNDEVNMLTSMIAKKLNVPTVIARVRNPEISREGSILEPSDLGMDVSIHPEEQAAKEIVMLLKRSVASDVEDLADGKLQVIGIRLEANSPIEKMTIQEFAQKHNGFGFNVVAISRKGTPIMARGNNRFMKDDQVFILAKKEDIPRVIETTGRRETSFSTIVIAEGSGVGEMVVEKILQDPDLKERKWRIKIILDDEEKAEEMAAKMPENIMVLNGNPTDPDLLNLEGFSDSDAYLALTDDEESNIISCLMAKHLQARKVVALISKKDYINISQTIGLDSAVNTKLAAANAIHRYIRRGNVLSITSLHGIAADAIELQVAKGSKVCGKKVHKIMFPGNSVVGAVTKAATGEIEIATGNTSLDEDDKVIIFTLPKNLSALSAMFQ